MLLDLGFGFSRDGATGESLQCSGHLILTEKPRSFHRAQVSFDNPGAARVCYGRKAILIKTSIAIPALWAAYIVALPFHRLWRLPWLDVKLQPPEVIFLGLAVASAVLWWQRPIRWRFTLADAAVAAWVGANAIALVLSKGPHGKEAIIETLGAAYLAGLYVAVRITATPRLLDGFGSWFGYSAAIAAALGIAGTAAAWMALPTNLATVAATPVPYIGHAPRAQAFTAGPQMLASILLMAVPLFAGSRMVRGWRRRDIACVLLLIAGLPATLSKTALCLAPALAVMWACAAETRSSTLFMRKRRRVVIAGLLSLWIAVVMIVGSQVIVTKKSTIATMSAAQLVGGQPLATFEWRDESWALMPSTYAFNWRASLEAIARSWPVGVGPAGQSAFTMTLQREGTFPWSIWITTPHSTYLGAVAERGAAGLVALALMLIAAGITIRRLLAGPVRFRWEAAAYAGAGTGFLIEALTTDLLNCRHYWLLLAVMVARVEAGYATTDDGVRPGFVTTVANK